MRGLFFKIFVIFWIAQSLIFVISTALIVRRHFVGPDVLYDTMASNMQANANRAVFFYSTRGCDGLRVFSSMVAQDIALRDANGQVLCGATGFDNLPAVETFPDRPTGVQVGNQYIWHLPVTSRNGTRYTYLLSRPHVPRQVNWYRDLPRFAFPQLPVAIVVGGLTTFALVLLFTQPVVRLRKAARELATGKLDARVKAPSSQSRIFAGDELAGLMHDFNHMAERLESLVDAQKLLLRDVSHELRSPLARLSVALELAREDAAPEMTSHLDRIERETEKLNMLIGQLLTLSSMEALERQKNFKPVSLNKLIERLVPDAQFEAQQRQCSVVFRAEVECTVSGNQELLYRAFENVVRNAIRYTDGGTEVEISLSAAKANGDQNVVLSVADRGPGIPPDQLKAVFHPFRRVDTARSPDTGGFGVGLAIADRAIRLHHGEVVASAREGGGAVIRMTLPAVEVHPLLATAELHRQ
jgi:two-component system, OmpR family, sensor histidine kinase CpxA